MAGAISSNDRSQIISRARRVVIKLGTAVLMREEGGLALGRFYSFIESIASLKRSGREILIVSSGAVGLGAERLGLERAPGGLPMKQACAAVGQGKLMSLYSQGFEEFGLTTAQLLLTEEDFSNRRRYLNLRGTVASLLEMGSIPIINENDPVSAAELEIDDAQPFRRVNFGDNDRLSALVASKVEADLLLILTDVEGLYDADPDGPGEAELIPVVEQITPAIETLAAMPAKTKKPSIGRGGIKTKIEAAKIATRSGCDTIVAGGKLAGVIDSVFAGEQVGTLFLSQGGLPGKRRWIAFATTVTAAVKINEGARHALVDKKASLLAAGVVEIRGGFERGDVVSIIDPSEREFARGVVNYSSEEARRISGKHSDTIDQLIENRNYDALITRDNLVLLD
jgi:glutamate 5-kinase